MYPQTHIYFAEKVLGSQNDSISLGSIFPDMIIGRFFNHLQAHSMGAKIYRFLQENRSLDDFRKAVVTHGFSPKGLDYYGDEKYLDYERGYCFEKGRAFILATVIACNIPYEMGWWKSHNIIEMGIELLVSGNGRFSEQIKSALTNRQLIQEVDEMTRCLWRDADLKFSERVWRFINFVDVERATPDSLAEKYRIQMHFKHGVEIDTKAVARLIDRAALQVSDDVEEFFKVIAETVEANLSALTKEGSKPLKNSE